MNITHLELAEKYLIMKNHIEELLDSILWDAYSSEDEVLEIGREMATKIGRLYGYGEEE